MFGSQVHRNVWLKSSDRSGRCIVPVTGHGLTMHDVADTDAPLTPTLSPSSGKGRWQPVSIVTGIVSIKGGYNTRGEAAQSIQYQIRDTTHLFVELDKNAPWFLKGVGGLGARQGDSKQVQAMTLLRRMFQKKLGEEPEAEAAVAGFV